MDRSGWCYQCREKSHDGCNGTAYLDQYDDHDNTIKDLPCDCPCRPELTAEERFKLRLLIRGEA